MEVLESMWLGVVSFYFVVDIEKIGLRIRERNLGFVIEFVFWIKFFLIFGLFSVVSFKFLVFFKVVWISFVLYVI